MYIPKAFDEKNKDILIEFIKNHNFATLISANQNIEVSHIPLYVQKMEGKDYLFGHLARANEHWKSLEGQVLAVFLGPHAYVSEKWYETSNVVPTWNYVAVHVSGEIKLTTEAELITIIEMMVINHEGEFSGFKKNIEESFFSSLLAQIVGFKIEIEKIEGKWKLSQNRSLDAQMKIANQLSKKTDENSKSIASLMRENIKKQ